MPLEYLYANTDLPGTASIYRDFSLTKNGAYRDECSFILDSADNTFTPEVGQIVDILEHPGAVRLFGGPIVAVNTRLIEGTTIRRSVVTCSDNSALAARVLAGEQTFVDRKLNDIILTLFDAGAGYSINTTSITPGGGPTIARLELDFPTLAASMDELMSIAGGGIWWIDEDRELRYQLGTPASPAFTINNATNWVAKGSLALETSLENYANKLVVTTNKYELPAETLSFGGSHPSQPTDGARTNWTMTNPVARQPTITVNGAAQTVGIEGVDTGKQWYWSQGSRDIHQDDAGTPLASSATLAVTYAGIAVAREYVENTGEIATRGIFERRVDLNTLTTQADLEQTAAALIAQYSQPSYILRFAVVPGKSQRPKPGDRVDITRSGYGNVTGLIVDQVQYIPTMAPRELQRVVTAKKGPRIKDGRELLATGAASGSISGSVAGGSTSGGSSLSWAPDVTASSGTVTPNHGTYTNFLINVAGNFTLDTLSGVRDAVPFEIVLKFDGTGGHEVTLHADYGTLKDIIPEPDSVYIIRGFGKGSGFIVTFADNL